MHFAINAAPINGQGTQFRLLEGQSDVALRADGKMMLGLMLAGANQVHAVKSLTASAGKMLEGAATATVDTSLRPTLLVKVIGQIGTTFHGAAVGASGVRISGDFDVRPGIGMVLTRRARSGGMLDVALLMPGDIRSTERVRIDGLFDTHLSGLMHGRRATAHRPTMSMRANLALPGSAWLRMAGQGQMRMGSRLVGELSLAGRVYVAGGMQVITNLRGEGRRYNHVTIEGVMKVRAEIRGERAGRPPIPDEYVEAPTSRRLVIARQKRERRIINERRL